MSASAPGSGGTNGGWKGLLALLSLSLCGLLWWNGLQQSLERPSVNDALTLRQLELAVQAAPLLPKGLRRALGDADPRQALARELQRSVEAGSGPPQPERTLELALLEGGARGTQRLTPLAPQLPPEQRALVTALVEGERPGDERIQLLLAPWPGSPLTRQLACGALGGSQSLCQGSGDGRSAVLRWLASSLGPVLLLLVGSVLLVRELWRRWRGTAPPLPPLQGPPLGLTDVTLLIAGGFVVLGELLVPLLLLPVVQAVVSPLAARPALAQALQVLLLYGGLMLVPLLILAALLRPFPREGWLQWRWRPLNSALGLAGSHVLMVLPLVALSGWLIEQLWSNPSGSNPLLELVLTNGDPLALAALALTATVLAPLFEETLFRGVLLPVLGRIWGRGWGVLVSALTFGLAHLSLGELTPLVVLGLALGWLRLRSGRLGPCVLMHSLWNGLTFFNLVLLT